MMKTRFLVVLLLLLTAAPALHAMDDETARGAANPKLITQQAEFAATSRQLEALGPFVSFTQGRIAFLDVAAARKAGFSEETLQLAQEMIDAQNEMLEQMRNRPQGDRQPIGLSFADREELQRFLTLATQVDRAVSGGYIAPLKAGSTNACGTFDNPVPLTAAPWSTVGVFRNRTDAGNYLVRLGFHSTAWYVGTSDYTRGRSYSSRWGVCSSPRFRDHGLVSSRFEARVQLGECNPEVFSYSWPYWNWPSYCNWWHSTH